MCDVKLSEYEPVCVCANMSQSVSERECLSGVQVEWEKVW